jgi:hypothetical protein
MNYPTGKTALPVGKPKGVLAKDVAHDKLAKQLEEDLKKLSFKKK